MKDKIKIGIIICNRYHTCTGGKCLRALYNREGAFNIYEEDEELKLVGYTTCGGCPGGNIEYAPQEMVKNGVQAIHLATGMVVGYPPCPSLSYFKSYIQEKYGVKVVIGTHPIPQKYYLMHTRLGTWKSSGWEEILKLTLCDEKTRVNYD